MTLLVDLLERDRLPDWLIRAGIRRLLAQRLREEDRPTPAALAAHHDALLAEWATQPIAVHTDDANEQHYEVPTQFFEQVLGRHMKYSGCLWEPGTATLDDAEEEMLALTCQRAQIRDGQSILELGCGWGSFSLFAAQRFPNARITAVSNSRTQKAHIDAECARRGLGNVRVITANVADCGLQMRADRVVSIEMFEHMRNHPLLLEKVAGWMNPDALLFLHIFSHRRLMYLFEVGGEWDWMARHFFTGGMMPSHGMMLRHQQHLVAEADWQVPGTHYQQTCEAWLRNMDSARDRLMPLFAEVYGPREALRWWVRWRVFFMACAELFGYRGGAEWIVSHYLFRRPAA